ncbi:hypothetical protein VTO58DRAFT_107350 [Aureobasidium pullulans]|uniref:U1 small nuclear ribonucleoprotein C n=2 Tax=Aureobasidium pullulans TaxID=5580 RepID=A0A074XUZ2_AURPU|nr:zf-U1-domain-containing protein [Aureobasidium pullulans EXF-150]KEQ85762.1 zf-U1-domain-containing protein [Aureobasidium pullulans EXF-150]
MPKFFCDYCDVYLTHDSMSVRKAHNSGRNHLRNVVDYYQQIGHEKAQSVIDSITSSYAAEGQASANPMLPGGTHAGVAAMPFGFPPGMPPPFGAPGAPPMPAGRGMPPFPFPPNGMPPFPPNGMPFPPPTPGAAGSPPQGMPFPPPGGMPFPPPAGMPFPPMGGPSPIHGAGLPPPGMPMSHDPRRQ